MTIGSRIIGTGRYVPEKNIPNQYFEEYLETSDEWIKSRTGIANRRFAEKDQATSDLGAKAALIALEKAGISPEAIDLIIVATVTPDQLFPSTACLVQQKIGAKNAACFDLEAACSGFVYGLAIGDQFIKTGFYKNILVIGAETLSRFLDMTNRNTCVLFGDGAGAAIISASEEESCFLGFDLGADGHGGKFLEIPAGGSKTPVTPEVLIEKMNCIQMDGSEVFKFAVRAMEGSISRALECADVDRHQLNYLVPHQANIRIISAAAKKLELSMAQVFVNLDRYGNMSAASVPVALDEAIEQNKITRNDVVGMVAFGAGLTWASAVMRY